VAISYTDEKNHSLV